MALLSLLFKTSKVRSSFNSLTLPIVSWNQRCARDYIKPTLSSEISETPVIWGLALFRCASSTCKFPLYLDFLSLIRFNNLVYLYLVVIKHNLTKLRPLNRFLNYFIQKLNPDPLLGKIFNHELGPPNSPDRAVTPCTSLVETIIFKNSRIMNLINNSLLGHNDANARVNAHLTEKII